MLPAVVLQLAHVAIERVGRDHCCKRLEEHCGLLRCLRDYTSCSATESPRSFTATRVCRTSASSVYEPESSIVASCSSYGIRIDRCRCCARKRSSITAVSDDLSRDL